MLLSHEAIHAKEMAKVELSTVDSQLASERAGRERDLAERRAHVRMIEEAQAEQERRDREAAEAAAARAAVEAETNPQRRNDGGANNSAPSATADGERWREEEERRLSAYEEAFRRIKEATGVSDVSEVITKFLTAEDTATHLKTLTKEAQSRIDGLLAARDDAKRAVEEARCAAGLTHTHHFPHTRAQHSAAHAPRCSRAHPGPPTSPHPITFPPHRITAPRHHRRRRYAGTAAAERKAVDELELQLIEARAQQERLKHRYDRMSKILLVRAGAGRALPPSRTRPSVIVIPRERLWEG